MTPSLTGFYFRTPEGPALVYMKRSLFKAPDPITTVETKQQNSESSASDINPRLIQDQEIR